MDETIFWLGLSIACPWPKKLREAITYFGGPKELWQADPITLRSFKKFTDKNVKEFVEKRLQLNLWAELEKLHKKHISLVTIDQSHYPTSLKNIFDPPPVLYVLGQIRPEDHLSVAMVGSRKATHYGQRVAEKLAADLALSGVTIVSGLARGIDTHALKGAVEKGGRTIAVLGSGVDVIYPRENEALAKKIAENGAVISEFPLGTSPRPWHFPLRNRIISGLALGVMVVEAADSSGSLITADQALEQGREVFAVPGPIYNEQSTGCHNLIRQGATLVRTVEDVLGEISPNNLFKGVKSEEPKFQLTTEEKLVFQFVTMEPIFIDKITEKSNLTTGQVAAILMFLELKGLVQQLPGKKYVKKSF